MIRFARPALTFLRHAKNKIISAGHTSARDVKAIGPVNDAKIQFPTPIMKNAENAIPMRVRGPAGSFDPRMNRREYRVRTLRGKTAFILVTIAPVDLAGNFQLSLNCSSRQPTALKSYTTTQHVPQYDSRILPMQSLGKARRGVTRMRNIF